MRTGENRIRLKIQELIEERKTKVGGNFAVIDTETTWSCSVMSVGVIVADSDTFEQTNSRYYVIREALREGGMFSSMVHMRSLPERMVTESTLREELGAYLYSCGVSSIFAYNAKFDRNCLSFLSTDFAWHDIMRLAAYKQYNPAIPENAPCCKTGRLKSGYGVEEILRMLGNRRYVEKHNAYYDAQDELEIMRLLKHPLDMYPELR